MSLIFNQEQRLLADTAREFLAARSPVAAQRRLRDERAPLGFDPALWSEMVELGWSAIPFPEDFGGLDFGCQSLGPLFEQIGRNLSASPLLSSVVLAGSLLQLAGSAAQQQRWLPALIAGDKRLALAIDEAGRHDPLATELRAECGADGWRLSGAKLFVVDGLAADGYLVLVRTAGQRGEAHGLSLLLVEAGAPGLSVAPAALIDSRNCARLQFDGVLVGADALVGEAHGALPALETALDRGRVCLAAELLGAAETLFATTLDYLKTRVQFDAPIGSFQALQHRAARLYAELALARSAVMAGLAALDDASMDAGERARLASLAKWKAGIAADRVSNEAVQMHGGIGVTDELDVGLYLKRIRVAQACLGDTDYHCQRYGALV